MTRTLTVYLCILEDDTMIYPAIKNVISYRLLVDKRIYDCFKNDKCNSKNPLTHQFFHAPALSALQVVL